jgi:hypothetical protein
MPKFVTKDRDVWPGENTEDQRYCHQEFRLLMDELAENRRHFEYQRREHHGIVMFKVISTSRPPAGAYIR